MQMPAWLLLASLTVPRLGAAAAIGQQECRPLNLPKRIRSLDLVVDSTALVTRLQALDALHPAEVIVSVLLANGGSGHVVTESPDTATGDQVVQHVVASLRPISKDAPAAFRVHVRFGPTPSIALEPSLLCAPVAVDEKGEIRVPFFEVRRVPEGSLPPRPLRDVTPSLRIDPTGRVLEVNLGSGTGSSEVDRGLREMMLGERYRPALLDGRPVEVWLTGKRVELVR
jgi:hypothetical protein